MHRYQAPNAVFEAVRRGRWVIARRIDTTTGETKVLKQFNYDLDGEKAILQASKLAKRHSVAHLKPPKR